MVPYTKNVYVRFTLVYHNNNDNNNKGLSLYENDLGSICLCRAFRTMDQKLNIMGEEEGGDKTLKKIFS